MADYNVNMKQWNGNSFDNVLPLAYNAKQLGGQSLAEVKQWVQDNNLLLYTGQYTGTGTYGKNNPISVTFPFEAIAFIMPQNFSFDYSTDQFSLYVPLILGSCLENDYKVFYYNTSGGKSSLNMKISEDKKTISWYGLGNTGQMNRTNVVYRFAAIGGYDMGGQLNG